MEDRRLGITCTTTLYFIQPVSPLVAPRSQYQMLEGNSGIEDLTEFDCKRIEFESIQVIVIVPIIRTVSEAVAPRESPLAWIGFSESFLKSCDCWQNPSECMISNDYTGWRMVREEPWVSQNFRQFHGSRNLAC